MYKGKLQFTLDLGSDLKYDLAGDPDGIIPEEASVDEGMLVWELSSTGWQEFSFAWEVGSWLADSAVTSPANLNFSFVGTYSDGDNGYVDNLQILKSKQKIGATPFIESSIKIYDVYAIESVDFDTTYTIETSTNPVIVGADSELEALAAHFTLPSVTDWTEWKLVWDNPSGDIGSNLTIVLDNETPGAPIFVTPENPVLPDEDAGYTYFDDFTYQFTTSVRNKPAPQKQLHIYPNPAVDVLYLSVLDQLSKIDIYNSIGQMVISLDNPQRKINVAGLKSGIYFMNVTDLQGTIYKTKFIKE
jgi:hypothetical protein